MVFSKRKFGKEQNVFFSMSQFSLEPREAVSFEKGLL